MADLYLDRIRTLPERVPNPDDYPFSLPSVRNLDLELSNPVTILVGENGSGKSTLLEAIAISAGFSSRGGAGTEIADFQNERGAAQLSRALRLSFRRRHRTGFFFRAETTTYLADLLEARKADPDFRDDPYKYYGRKTLHERSHGEGFMQVFLHRINGGLVILDEPESALSPVTQLALIRRIYEMIQEGKTQIIMATHSPLMMSYPGAEILSVDASPIAPIRVRDTAHYQIMRRALEDPRLLFFELGIEDI